MPLASLIRLVLLGMIWGASFLFQRITVPAVGVAFTASIRIVLSALMLVLIARPAGAGHRPLQQRHRRLTGYAAIRDVWRRIFEGGVKFRIRLADGTAVQTPFSAVHTVIEHVSVRDDESQRAPVVATNVFVRGALGWRLVLHHASPAPPETLAEAPKILH